ncbi:MAG: hypothetical protein KJ879_00035 [Nanoarchaeota archaeon]|nr:hypothetical protein [Nanoarchaeota archaeon]
MAKSNLKCLVEGCSYNTFGACIYGGKRETIAGRSCPAYQEDLEGRKILGGVVSPAVQRLEETEITRRKINEGLAPVRWGRYE